MDREFILAEIQRISRNGKPPGIQTFSKITGIREYDWQRYWSKWSDALAEAGYEPNKLSEAYPEEYLLEKLIDIVRERGGIPTARELRIGAAADPSLPRGSTFYARFGGRAGLLDRLRRYAIEGGFEDVVTISEAAILATNGETAAESPESLKTWVQGYVYMTKAGRDKYKVGRTNSPTRRHRELRINIPEPTSQIHAIPTDDPPGIEAYWHKRFENKRIPGTEFFKLDAADVAAFKRRRLM